ncbi:hypothetical protein C5167_034015, partial [Papaver somniferum]
MPYTRSRPLPSSSRYRASSARPSSSRSQCPISPPSSSQISFVSSQGDKFQSPFKGFDECGGGVRGRGYAKSSIYRHLTDMHFPTIEAKDICRARIQNDANCFNAWESILAGPLNDNNDADFLIYGTQKPQSSEACNPASQNSTEP